MIKILKNLQKREVIYILLVFAFTIIQVWLELKIPDYMSEITKLVETEGSQMSEILKNGAYMVMCAFASLLRSSNSWIFCFKSGVTIFYAFKRKNI